MLRLLAFVMVFVHGCHCYAGFPPTTLKGQNDATQPTTFNYQVPFFQSTRTAGTNALIETGNTNILRNPGFEATTATSNWTASGGVVATDTSTQLIGLKSVTWDASSASQTFTSDAVTIPRGLYGRNGEVSCLIQVASGTATHTLQAFDGTNILASSTINNSTLGARTTVNFIIPSSGNVQLRLVSVAADEPLIEIDECYMGEATNLSQVSQATFAGGMEQAGAANCLYSQSTSTGFNNFVTLGTAPSCTSPWVNQGSITNLGATRHEAVYNNMPPGNYQIVLNGTFQTTSSGGSCAFRLSDGTNTFQPQTIGATLNSNSGTYTFHISYTSAGNRTFTLQASDDHSGSCQLINSIAGLNASWKFYRFPTSGELVVRVDQSNYDWIDGGAITITGTTTNPTKGTTTRDKVFYKREGQNLLLRYEYSQTVAGTAGSGDYLFAIPAASGCTIDTTRIGTSTTVGSTSGDTNNVTVGAASAGISGAAGPGIVSVFSTTALRFMIRDSASATYRALSSASFALSNANLNYSAQASVPCVGWQENRGAPLLVGSVTSPSSGAEVLVRASVGTACGASPCTISRQSGGVSTITRTSAGIYPVNFVAGTYSASPSCTATIGQDAAGAITNGWIIQITDVSSSAVTVRTFNNTGTSVDYPFNFICMGPR